MSPRAKKKCSHAFKNNRYNEFSFLRTKMTLSSLTQRNMQNICHQSQGQVSTLGAGAPERYSLTVVISLLIAIDTGDALKAL